MSVRAPRRAARNTPSRRAGPSVAFVLAALFVGSVAVRLAGGTAQAIAREVGEFSAGEAAEPAAATGGGELDAVLSRLREREAELDERADRLDRRAEELEAVETAVRQKLDDLAAAEDRLRQTMAIARTAAENDVTQLTSVYANMKPADAAAIFEEMAPEFAAGFLARMEPEAAARIVAGLEPNTAYSISVILAGRNVNVPTQ